MKPTRLDNRHVLVIGASGGIGCACAEVALGLGARVSVAARSPERIAQQFGGRASILPALDWQSPTSDWDGALGAVDALDGVVFATGVLVLKPWRSMAPEEFRRINTVNYEGPALFTRELLRHRKLRDGASIVFVASVAARMGSGGHAAYSGTKGALTAFTRSLAVEVAPRRIRVNSISPGVVRTSMSAQIAAATGDRELAESAGGHPLGLGEPVDVAHAACFLLTDAARWITGSDLVVDGGLSIN